MRLCFDMKLLWYFSPFHGLLSKFRGALVYQIIQLRPGNAKPVNSVETSDFQNPQSISLDQMRPYKYI